MGNKLGEYNKIWKVSFLKMKSKIITIFIPGIICGIFRDIKFIKFLIIDKWKIILENSHHKLHI